jgi:hypothetical protein
MKILKAITHSEGSRRQVLIKRRDDGLFTFTYENGHTHIDEEFDVRGGLYATAEAAEKDARCSVPMALKRKWYRGATCDTRQRERCLTSSWLVWPERSNKATKRSYDAVVEI